MGPQNALAMNVATLIQIPGTVAETAVELRVKRVSILWQRELVEHVKWKREGFQFVERMAILTAPLALQFTVLVWTPMTQCPAAVPTMYVSHIHVLIVQ